MWPKFRLQFFLFIEFESDVKALYDIMNRNYRDLSTFERWVSQVHSGALRYEMFEILQKLCFNQTVIISTRWGIVHTEKFWRENAKFAEANDFNVIKQVINLLKSEDPVSFR